MPSFHYCRISGLIGLYQWLQRADQEFHEKWQTGKPRLLCVAEYISGGYSDRKQELPELKKDTFGADFTEILKNKQTFSEGYSDMSKPIMVRQRLKNLEKKLFKVLEEGGL